MAKILGHPKRVKVCAFCEYWMGDAELKFISTLAGYQYEPFARGKCAKKNTVQHANAFGSNCYQPSREAQKLL